MNVFHKHPRFLSLFAIMLALTLTACGGKKEAPPSAEPVEQASTQPTAPPAEPTAAPAEPTAAPAEPTAAPAEVNAGAPDADIAAAVPIMDGATGVVSARENTDYVVTYQSSAGVDAIAAFYQAEMPQRGWTYDAGESVTLPGVSAELNFNRSDGEAAVQITTLGLGTQVAVAVSGAAADVA